MSLTFDSSENQASATLIRGVLITAIIGFVVMTMMIRPVRKIIERVSTPTLRVVTEFLSNVIVSLT